MIAIGFSAYATVLALGGEENSLLAGNFGIVSVLKKTLPKMSNKANREKNGGDRQGHPTMVSS